MCLGLVSILLVGGASGAKSFACSLLLEPVIKVSLFPSWNLVVAGMLYCLAEFIVNSMSGGRRGPRSGSPAPCEPRLYTWLATHVDLSEAVLGFTGLPAGKSWEALWWFGLNWNGTKNNHSALLSLISMGISYNSTSPLFTMVLSSLDQYIRLLHDWLVTIYIVLGSLLMLQQF